METNTNKIKIDEKLLKRDTYELKQVVLDMNGQIDAYVYENDKLHIKTPQKQQSDEYLKIQKLIADQTEFEQLLKTICGGFYFYFMNGGLLGMDIKESIKARFLYLCTYSNYKEKGMYLLHDGNGKKMDRKAIAEVLGLSDREFKTTIKTLLDNELLVKDGDFFMVNQQVATRGKLTTKQEHIGHTRIFDDGLRELYRNCTARQHKQLYYLFKLLPYINIKFNIICQNPSEQDINDVIPLSLSEICEAVGYDTSQTRRFEREMYKLKLYDKLVIVGVKSLNGTYLKVNPLIVYAGTSGHLEEFKELLATDFRASVKLKK